ncbi:MAG: cupin domain-containing protein [Bryobacteraceae bacterium]|jgi:anti-sigma factor ChrR (cupin superfamily)
MGNTIPQAAHDALNDDLREQASLYSLGLLEPADAGRWELHLEHCALCRGEVRASMELLVAVSAAEAERVVATLPDAKPPARVREALMRRMAVPSPAAHLILRAGEGRWRKTLPGIEVKRLFVDPVTRSVTSLVRVAAGALYPAHIHRGLEHLYVLDGDIVFDDHTLSTGDYEVRSADTRHSSATTAAGEGCLLLVINSGRDEFLQ